MKITKADNLLKKIFFLLILVFLILITSVSGSFTQLKLSEQSNISTNNAQNIELYETGTFYNLVILTELADAQFNQSNDFPIIEDAFNDTNSNSLRSYYKEQSGGTLDIISVFMFCSSSTTTNSFKNLSNNNQASFVNSALNGEIYADINKNNVFTGDLDKNDDGLIDSVTLYLPLTITNNDYDTAAWPHMTPGVLNLSTSFKGLKYDRFIVNCYRYSDGYRVIDAPIGVMCHEMMHNIGNDVGIQDLYHYPDDNDADFEKLQPVGTYCIMASTDYVNPQPLNVYYKSKLGWATIEDITSGSVTFSKTEAKGIKFGVKKFDTNHTEFFIAQYWKENNYNYTNPQDNNSSGSAGVIIYRVNTAITTGNMCRGSDKRDEIYIFRLGEGNETSPTFPPLKNGTYKNLLTYSDGEDAKMIVKINIGTNDVTLNIERYALEFKIDGEFVPYEISVKLNGGTWEKTTSGVYVFSEDEITSGRIDFKCVGYKFYSNIGLTSEITYVMLDDYGLNNENFVITIYVKAIPRDIVVYFKDFEGNPLTFNLNSINYTFDGQEGTFVVENYSIEFSESKNFQVKNGDKIYLTLDINGSNYKVELLEITPDVITETTIYLAKLCRIEGVITHKGNPLPNVKVFVDGEYVTQTDSNGKFILENIPQGAIISFELKNYQINDFKVINDDLNLSITAKNFLDDSIIIIIIASVVIGIIILATLISISISKKKNSYITNEHYDE